MRVKIFGFVFACVLALASTAREVAAQEAGGDGKPTDSQSAAVESPYDLKRGTYEIGFWAGGSPGTTTFFGKSPDRKLFITAFRAGRVMGSKKHFTFELTVDVVPFIRLVQPREARRLITDEGRVIIATSGPDADGVGISPIGLKFLFRRRERAKPFVQATGGILYFERPVPYDAARSFNYTFDFGAGVQIFSRSRNATTLGYKFHHISNAYTGRINPGVDSHVFYAGFSLFR
jgi:hypothetical protein